jgi:hypothetical protein
MFLVCYITFIGASILIKETHCMNRNSIHLLLAGLLALALLTGCGGPPAEPTPTSTSEQYLAPVEAPEQSDAEAYPTPGEAPEQSDVDAYPLSTPVPTFDPYAEPEE